MYYNWSQLGLKKIRTPLALHTVDKFHALTGPMQLFWLICLRSGWWLWSCSFAQNWPCDVKPFIMYEGKWTNSCLLQNILRKFTCFSSIGYNGIQLNTKDFILNIEGIVFYVFSPWILPVSQQDPQHLTLLDSLIARPVRGACLANCSKKKTGSFLFFKYWSLDSIKKNCD